MYSNFFKKKALRWSNEIVRKVFTKENVAEELCSPSICKNKYIWVQNLCFSLKVLEESETIILW